MNKKLTLAALLVASLFFVACGDSGGGILPDLPPTGAPDTTADGSVSAGGICTTDTDCTSSLICLSGLCTAPALPDTDMDGIADDTDNCDDTANAGQEDADADRIGNACDDDIDNDGLENASDNCPYTANPAQTDSDSDGAGDACDADFDNDGVPNDADNCPNTPNSGQENMDGDETGNVCDNDTDGDTFVAVSAGGDDCNDNDASINPGAGDLPDMPLKTDSNCDAVDGDADSAIWVSSATGNDSNSGTLTQPLKTITAAIALTDTDPRKNIYVITDTADSYASPIVITSTNGVTGIYGGFGPDGSRNTDESGVLLNLLPIDARWSIMKDVVIEGMPITYSNNADNEPAVKISNASPILKYNIVARLTASGTKNIAIMIEAVGTTVAKPKINNNYLIYSAGCNTNCSSVAVYAVSQDNESNLELTLRDNAQIIAGDALNVAYATAVNIFSANNGISVMHMTGNEVKALSGLSSQAVLCGFSSMPLEIKNFSRADISRNLVIAGTNNNGVISAGISLSRPSDITTIDTNFINGGLYPESTSSYGIYLYDTHDQVIINNNTINGGKGSMGVDLGAIAITMYGSVSFTNSPFIENNILFGESTLANVGIQERVPTIPSSLIGNLFDSSLSEGISGLYMNDDVYIKNIGDVNSLADISPDQLYGNIMGDAVNNFVNIPMHDYHLLAASPAINMAAAGNTSTDFDYDAEPRLMGPKGDIGADEFVE